tara:strand:+ start:461 stop:1975 length:1515 start_codon:yes stop_codon:yes gene_type:complete
MTLFGCNKKVIVDKNEKMNVLFLIADDLNCDLGSYNHPQVISPSIDKLASQGLLFENAHNQYPLCGPSRASFMTGMYSDQTKITRNNVLLRTTVPDVITMGQRFRQQGYRSVRIGKIYHYDNPSSIGTSSADDIYTWDYTINPWGRDKEEEYKINTLKERQYGGVLSWLAADGTDEEQTDGIVATEAMEQLEKFSKNGQNFFLAVGMYRPHVPFVAPKKYFNMYDRDSMEILYSGVGEEYLNTLPKPAAKSVRWSDRNQGLLALKSNNELAKEIKEAYFATTTFMDAQIGRILKKLKQTGLDKNTIVVFTSDHGYHLSEHGHWQKQTLFENATRIPLIFSGPGIESGKRTNSPVEMIDIYPTLMELTGIETPDHVVGKSLSPIFKNNSASVRSSALTQWKNGYSIKTERYRITKWGENGELGYELYDHNNDKEELINLANNPNYSTILDSLKKAIDFRIVNARVKPDGLGRQLEQESYKKAPNITPGDLFDKSGKRVYFKPANE